jgi:putative endonuclease
MYDVYTLQSRTSHRYYVGSTQDFTNRLDEHNRGESRPTRSGIPWVVVRVEHFDTRSEAMAQEKRIKSRGIARYLKDVGRQPG